VLQAQDARVLDTIHAVYLADISGMPALISTLFALPKLKELPFAVGIVRDAAQTAQLPRRPDQITVLVLDAGRVRQVLHAGNADALKQALGL
jgi:NADPH-dependent ferric siderophore reductase